MSRESDLALDILNRINGVKQFILQSPLWLGGSSGSGGGNGGRPGGFLGVLPQTRVAGDSTESFLYAQSSGSPRHLLDNLDRLRAFAKPAHNFYATSGSPPTNFLTISSGSWHHTSGQAPLSFVGGNSPPLVAPTSGSRYNLLTITTGGVLSWTHGTDGDPPSMVTFPSPTSGSMPLWLVLGRSSGSVIRFYDDGISHYLFRDVRPFLDWGIGGAGGGSGSSPQPAGRVVFTDANGAAITDPDLLYDQATGLLSAATTGTDATTIAGTATGVGGIGIYGEADGHRGFGLYGLSVGSTSGSALYAEGSYGGAARILISGGMPTPTFDHTANVAEIERAIGYGAEHVSANVTGALLDLYDNTYRAVGVGGTTSGSLIRGRVDLTETFGGGAPTTVFSVTRAGHIVTSGSIDIQGFRLSPGAVGGYVLTSSATGVGTWQPSTGSSPQPGGRVLFTDANGAPITDPDLTYDQSLGTFKVSDGNINLDFDDPTSRSIQITSAYDDTQSGYFVGRHSRGTLASPSALLSNDDLAGLIAWGHTGSAWAQGGGIFCVATQDWGANAGTRIDFQAHPTGGGFDQVVAVMTGDGQFQVPITGVNAGVLVGGDFLLYRSAADMGRTPDGLTVDLGLNIGSASGAATGEVRASLGFVAGAGGTIPAGWVSAAVGHLARTDGSGGGYYAGALDDVQLYRSAADTWRTPDSFTVDVGLNVGSASGAGTGQVRASGGYYHSAAVFAAASGNYHALYEPAGNIAIYLGNATDPSNAYDNTNHAFRSRAGAAEYARLLPGPIFLLGDTANTFMTAGITINQGANDNEALALKSSDVAHGVTDLAETDTYGFLRKINATLGGLDIWGFTEGGDPAITLAGVVTTADTAKTTGASGAFRIRGMVKSGTTATNLGADANIAVFLDLNTTRFILDADGDSHQDVGTAWTNFDEHDDIGLLTALSMSVSRDYEVRNEFVEWVKNQRPLLEKLKLVTYNDDGHHFVNMSKLSMLLVGAVRQLASNTKQLESKVESLHRLLDRIGD